MADKQGFYWDHEQCGWVRCPKPAETIDVPQQPTGLDRAAATPNPTGIAAEQGADVRSG